MPIPQLLSLDRLRELYPPTTFTRALKYADEGRVDDLEVELEPEEGLTTLYSAVHGSAGDAYDVEVEFGMQNGHLQIRSECNCPVFTHCKHALATLIVWSRQLGKEDTKAAPTSRDDLDYTLRDFLDRAERIVNDACLQGDTDAVQPSERLFYLLQPPQRATTSPAPHLFLVKAARRRSGVWAQREEWWPSTPDTRRWAKFITPGDVELIEGLMLLPRPNFAGDGFVLTGVRGAELLHRLAASGRLAWERVERPALKLGAPRPAQAEWQLQPDGAQTLRLVTVPASACTWPTSPPWYGDPQSGEVGPVETQLPPAIASLVARGANCTPQEVAVAAPLFEAIVPLLPPPKRVDVELVTDMTPTPILSLSTLHSTQPFYQRSGTSFGLDVGRVSFRYGEHVVGAEQHKQEFIERYGERVRKIVRHAAAESAALAQLAALQLLPLPPDLDERIKLDPSEVAAGLKLYTLPADWQDRWAVWVERAVPDLERQGWVVEYARSFRHRVVRMARRTASLRVSADVGWFDVELGAEVDGTIIDLNPFFEELAHRREEERAALLVANPATAPPLSFQLPDGRELLIPIGWIQGVLRTIIEVADPHSYQRGSGALRVSAAALVDLKQLEAADIELRLDEGVDRLHRLVSDRAERPKWVLPSSFRAELRDYQREGVEWLQWLRCAGVGGVLADDMGLGKTVQALAHLASEKQAGRLTAPALIVAPTSLVANWESEAERFAPELRRLTFHGADRKGRFEAIAQADLVITTYPLLLRDAAQLAAYAWSIAILDEAQAIKNSHARTAKVVRMLRAGQWLAMTGTPMENHLGELWSIVDAVCPGLLGDARSFSRVFRGPIERKADNVRGQALERRIAPFMLRRTKDQVAKELPPKTEIVQRVALAGAQRTLYEAVRVSVQEKVDEAIRKLGINRSQIVILEALLRLRQVCCDPQLLAMPEARKVEVSAKGDLLWDLLPQLLDEGRQVLLFSSFATMLRRIELQAQARGIAYSMIIGETKDRRAPVAEFQSGRARLMLISLKAGGVGLNLTAADSVIHYDPWWNPAAEDQATDRAHRIGQTKPVFVYKLIASGTVEERMLELQARKRALVSGVVRASAKSGHLIDHEDLQELLGPVGG